MIKAKIITFLFMLACLIALGGCATTDDSSVVKKDPPVVAPSYAADIKSLETMIRGINEEVVQLKQQAEKSEAVIDSLRRGQAEGGATITEIRDHLQQIRGSLEVLRKDVNVLTARTGKRDEENKEIRDRLENISFKINFLENFIGVGKRPPEPPEPPEKSKPASPAKETPPPVRVSKAERDQAYAAAYEIFKEGKYERARQDFLNFLRQFPDSEYADNAQFWIAETYYFENRFDRAIPEYEKVIRNYPDGNKLSHAMLKLGISYANLGDKAKARSLLQQVIKDFPNTAQARIARTKLSEIK